MGDGRGVGLTNDKERRHKLVLMHQASLSEFQRELKFGMEDKKCQNINTKVSMWG